MTSSYVTQGRFRYHWKSDNGTISAVYVFKTNENEKF